jgi:hypothetical protein
LLKFLTDDHKAGTGGKFLREFRLGGETAAMVVKDVLCRKIDDGPIYGGVGQTWENKKHSERVIR